MGLNLIISAKKITIISALLIFIALPVLLFITGDSPGRTVLKDSISILTIIAFALLLQQLFLTRHVKTISQFYKLSQISNRHKVTGYIIVPFFLLHPVLIVLPRFFEAGVEPLDALITIITTFESTGVILGLIAWGLMLVLGITALFRYRLVKKLGVNYKAWRYFHGSLSILFISLASWHAIELGRHINYLMAVFIIICALTGAVMLVRHYVVNPVIHIGAK